MQKSPNPAPLVFRFLSELSSFVKGKIVVALILVSVMSSMRSNAQLYWDLIDTFPGGPKTCLTGLNDSILLVGTGQGIFRSGDGGKSWKHLLASSVVYSLYASDPGTVVAGGIGEIFYSLDKGISWHSVDLQSDYHVKGIVENSQGEFFAITGGMDPNEGYVGSGVLFSDGDLSTWETRNTGIPFPSPYGEIIAVDRQDRLYVGIADTYVTGSGGLYISDDKGLHWQQVPLKLPGHGAVRAENVISINITPDDSVIVSSSGVVLNYGYSANLVAHRNQVANGNSWRQLRMGSSLSWMDRLLNHIHYTSDGRWYVSLSGPEAIGGTYASDDHGATWIKKAKGLAVSPSGRYERQSYYEDSKGRLYMVQYLDERVYELAGVDRPEYTVGGFVKDTNGVGLEQVVVYGLGTAVFTDESGKFVLTVPETSSGILSFVRHRYTFSPAIEIVDLKRDSTGIEVTATYMGEECTISGLVKMLSGVPLKDISINGADEMITTDEEGRFNFVVPAGWSGTIVPVQYTYQFQPAQWEIVNCQRDSYMQVFEAIPVTGISDGSRLDADVYPNPSFSGAFELRIRGEDDVMISIWTLEGSKVHEQRVYSSYGWEDQWQAPSLGVYILKIQSQQAHRYFRIVAGR